MSLGEGEKMGVDFVESRLVGKGLSMLSIKSFCYR